MSGGDPESLIEDVENTINKYIHSLDNKYIFQFDDVLNTKSHQQSVYLGAGGLTAVFGMKLIKSSDQIIPKRGLILRLVDDIPENDLHNYIDKWEEDKLILPRNIPDIYLYGSLYKGNKVIGLYSLVKQYEDYKSIDKLDMPNRIKLVKLLLQTLFELQLYRFTYRDIKFQNIGYEKDEFGNVENFIVLDHDSITLLDLDDTFFDQFSQTGCDWYCAGTYPPYYLINDYDNKVKGWLPKLDKLSTLGLFTIMVRIFYGKVGYTSVVGKYIDSQLNSGFPYDGLIELYTKNSVLGKFLRTIQNLQPLEWSLHDPTDSFIKNAFLLALLDPNYDRIPTYDHLLDIYTDYFG